MSLRSHDQVTLISDPMSGSRSISDPKAGLYYMVRAFDVDGPCTVM